MVRCNSDLKKRNFLFLHSYLPNIFCIEGRSRASITTAVYHICLKNVKNHAETQNWYDKKTKFSLKTSGVLKMLTFLYKIKLAMYRSSKSVKRSAQNHIEK